MIQTQFRTLRLLTVFLTGSLLAPLALSAPYPVKGRPTRWVQPDGTVLHIRVFGDDFYGRAETEEGYTVVYNEKTRAYHYAQVSSDGLKLEATATQAHLRKPKGIAPHLERTKEGIRKVRLQEMRKRPAAYQQNWQRRTLDARARRAGTPKADIRLAPVNGGIRGLTILAQFPNDKSTTRNDRVPFPSTTKKIARFCNKVGYTGNGNAGSVRDYFFQQSGGKLTYTQTVTEIVTLPHPRNYYNFADYPGGGELRGAGEAGNLLITDAVNKLKSEGFDFSGLTTDVDGNILATNVFFAGADSGIWAAGLWPHQYNLVNPVDVGGIFVNNYQITNLADDSPVIGTFCHENGHLILDYPDLYDYGGESEGVGEHCLMGSGNYRGDGKIPAPINAYFKDVVGWANITDLTPDDYVKATLPSTGNVAYRIRRPGVDTEYFVVENRGKGDPWAADAVDTGIAVWHIDETVVGNDDEQMTPALHYQVSLEQADGEFDLERGLNRGDSRDLYDQNAIFDGSTLPDSDWWTGNASGARVKVLGKPSANVSVQFGPLPPDTIIVGGPDSGQMLFRNTTVAINWEANVSGDLKIDLFKGGVFDSEIVATTANTGSYVWTVPSDQAAGDDYTIRIRTLTNPNSVIDFSDSPFVITKGSFPATKSLPYGWSKPKSASKGWKVSDSVAYEGKYSLMSARIGDGKTAGVSYKSSFLAGDVSFYVKTSTELNFDHVRFYIDGVPQLVGDSTYGLSGERGWTYVSVPLSAGRHTLMWTYEKDDSYGDSQDRVWIDGVNLPPTTQEIAIVSPGGKEIESAASSVQFRDTSMGRKSKPKTFTIRNTGKADLTGLAVQLSGSGKKSFTVGGLSKKSLKPGASTKFNVWFTPNAEGAVSAKLMVRSNDADESPFVVRVKGMGKGLPKLAVFQPQDNRLKDGKETLGFGIAPVGSEGRTLSVTVRNRGVEPLRLNSLETKGDARKDFKVKRPSEEVVAPGSSVTVRVTFRPSKKNLRTAKLVIRTNDRLAGPFTVELKGKGAPRRRASAVVDAFVSAPVSGAAKDVRTRTSLTIVDGAKYRTLTVRKDSVPTGMKPVVEVSGDLLEWLRGDRHTTVLENNASVLKVRDNTPVEPGVKRHIRVRLLRR